MTTKRQRSTPGLKAKQTGVRMSRQKKRRDTLEEWVHAVNAQARLIEGWAAALHPSVWREQLGPEEEHFIDIARSGPLDEPPDRAGEGPQ